MPILGLAIYGGVDLHFTASDIAAIKFTVLQAILSAVLSVAAAIPTSRALARQNFKGREVLISILSAPFILPVIVAISGVLFIFGREGSLQPIPRLIWPRNRVYLWTFRYLAGAYIF